MGPIFNRLQREIGDDRVSFIRYTVPASHEGGPIIEDLIDRGYVAVREETSAITGAVTQTADLGCFSGTGQICVHDGDSLEFITRIGANYSFEEARAAALGMLDDTAKGGGDDSGHGLKSFEP